MMHLEITVYICSSLSLNHVRIRLHLRTSDHTLCVSGKNVYIPGSHFGDFRLLNPAGSLVTSHIIS